MIGWLKNPSKTIISAAFVVGIAGLASRLLGLLRQALLASSFGASDYTDIFYAAFAIPDMVFAILAMGAIGSAFIPVLSRAFVHEQDREQGTLPDRLTPNSDGARLTLNVFNSLIVVIGIASLVLIIFAPTVVALIAPGFTNEKQVMTVMLTRIMLLQPVLLAMGNVVGGMLQTLKHFVAFSFAPLLYNLGILIGIVWFYPLFGLRGLAWGVVLGALMHFGLQLASGMRLGFRWRPHIDWGSPQLRRVLTLTLPRTIGLAADKINIVVIIAIASTLATGSVSIFSWANDLQFAPVGIIAVAFATAVFPSLSADASAQKLTSFSRNFHHALNYILFIVLPVAVLMFVLRAQIVRLILGFEVGQQQSQFGWYDTQLTAAALGLFTFGIFAQSLIPLVARAFYAFQNTVTPVVIAVCTSALNIILSIVFVSMFRNNPGFAEPIASFLDISGLSNIAILGLPLAFSIAGIVQFMLLWTAFKIQYNHVQLEKVLLPVIKIVGASLIAGLVAFWALRPLAALFDTATGIGLLWQTIGASIAAGIAYLIIAYLIRIDAMHHFVSTVNFLFNGKK